jgi:hypothetical protein
LKRTTQQLKVNWGGGCGLFYIVKQRNTIGSIMFENCKVFEALTLNTFKLSGEICISWSGNIIYAYLFSSFRAPL